MTWLIVWEKTKAVGRWLKKNWTVPLVGISVLVGVILGRKGKQPTIIPPDNKPVRPAGDAVDSAKAASGAIHAVEAGERRKADGAAADVKRDIEKTGNISDEQKRLESLANIGKELRDKRKGETP